MPSRFSIALLATFAAYCSSALADDSADKRIMEAGLREAREIIQSELFGHYDLTNLVVLKVEALQSSVPLGHDYGLTTVTLMFSAKRNATKHPNLSPAVFEPDSPMCKDWRPDWWTNSGS
jgi:hypothetical protein